jgi:hypothetical protein
MSLKRSHQVQGSKPGCVVLCAFFFFAGSSSIAGCRARECCSRDCIRYTVQVLLMLDLPVFPVWEFKFILHLPCVASLDKIN